MPNKSRVDEITHIGRLLATGHTINEMCGILDCGVRALQMRISRNAYALVKGLPPTKYELLTELIKKNKPPGRIATICEFPLTFVNCAIKLYNENDYPVGKR